MELQLINLEWREQATGSLSFVSDKIVHSNEESVSFEGQVSVTVKFPISLKWNSSKRGSDDGEIVAFTDEYKSQVLPTMLTRLPNSLVSLDSTEFLDIRMYVDLSPFFR